MSDSVVFVGAKRTPFGSFGGSFQRMSATDLAVHASKAALNTSGIDPRTITHSIFGNVIQSSPDAAYLARHVGLKVGVPLSSPALTVNRLCGSGFEALIQASWLLKSGEASTVLAGGTENMTQAPYVLRGARFGLRLSNSEIEDSLMSGLFDSYAGIPMAITAENLAEKYGISRSQCDEYALRSQERASQATKTGIFQDELAPVEIASKSGVTKVERDEHLRFDCTYEGLAKLKTVFKKDGTVTAGNASGMTDGAAALLMTRDQTAKEQGWKVLGELVSSHVVGCDPSIMGIGPVEAIKGLLKKSGLTFDEIKLIEVNEAFAAQFLSVAKELSLPMDKTNVDGGAIAIGHPLGASGARITAHLLYRLRQMGGGYGIGSACIGGGQGIAVLLKV
jgi:acetyl-CoA acyltransferase 2